jgi:hypothetical protein
MRSKSKEKTVKPIKIKWPDSCSADIFDDGSYDFVFPSGKHRRGREADVEAARQTVNATHDSWALECWAKGTLAGRGRFVCNVT